MPGASGRPARMPRMSDAPHVKREPGCTSAPKQASSGRRRETVRTTNQSCASAGVCWLDFPRSRKMSDGPHVQRGGGAAGRKVYRRDAEAQRSANSLVSRGIRETDRWTPCPAGNDRIVGAPPRGRPASARWFAGWGAHMRALQHRTPRAGGSNMKTRNSKLSYFA